MVWWQLRLQPLNWSFHQRPNKCDAPPDKTISKGARVFRLERSTGFLCVGWTLSQKRRDVATKYFFCSRRFVWFPSKCWPRSRSHGSYLRPSPGRVCLGLPHRSLPLFFHLFFPSSLLSPPPAILFWLEGGPRRDDMLMATADRKPPSTPPPAAADFH